MREGVTGIHCGPVSYMREGITLLYILGLINISKAQADPYDCKTKHNHNAYFGNLYPIKMNC